MAQFLKSARRNVQNNNWKTKHEARQTAFNANFPYRNKQGTSQGSSESWLRAGNIFPVAAYKQSSKGRLNPGSRTLWCMKSVARVDLTCWKRQTPFHIRFTFVRSFRAGTDWLFWIFHVKRNSWETLADIASCVCQYVTSFEANS